MWFAAKFPSPTARSEENPDGIVSAIQNARRSVRISILFISVRWTGHFFAISISCLRGASSNGPANSMLHRMRSILDFGSSQFAQSSAWTRSCRSRTMTCSRVHFFPAAYCFSAFGTEADTRSLQAEYSSDGNDPEPTLAGSKSRRAAVFGRTVMCSGAEQEREPQRFGYCAQPASVFGGTQDATWPALRCAGRQPCTVMKSKRTGKQDRRLSFDKSSPALPDRILLPLPVTDRVGSAM